MSHRIKKVAGRYDVSVVFSAPNKLNKICPRVNKKAKNCQGTCGVHHKKEFVACATGVVYSIPLACGKVYIGQTGRCLNIRLKENRY